MAWVSDRWAWRQSWVQTSPNRKLTLSSWAGHLCHLPLPFLYPFEESLVNSIGSLLLPLSGPSPSLPTGVPTLLRSGKERRMAFLALWKYYDQDLCCVNRFLRKWHANKRKHRYLVFRPRDIFHSYRLWRTTCYRSCSRAVLRAAAWEIELWLHCGLLAALMVLIQDRESWVSNPEPQVLILNKPKSWWPG